MNLLFCFNICCIILNSIAMEKEIIDYQKELKRVNKELRNTRSTLCQKEYELEICKKELNSAVIKITSLEQEVCFEKDEVSAWKKTANDWKFYAELECENAELRRDIYNMGINLNDPSNRNKPAKSGTLQVVR